MNNVQGYKNVLADKYMRDTNYILIKDTNDLDELEKQWDKFNSYLTIRQQRLADDKSIELWNMTNQQHYLLQKEKLLPKEDPAENIIQDKEDQFPIDTIGDIDDSMGDMFKSFEPLEESDDIKDKDISDSSKESISNQYTIDTNINIVGKDYTSIHNGLDELEKDFTAWNSQSHDLRKKSDDKCREIYGMSNIERYNKIKGELLRYDTPSSKISKVSPEDETNSNDSLKTINVEESIKSIGGFVLEQYNSRKALNEKEESIVKNKHRRFNDTPYFTPQELIDLGVHGNDNFYSKTPDNDGLITKVKIPTWFDSYKDMCMDHIFEDYRKDWIDTLDMLYSDFDDIKKSGDEEKILSRKQSILDLGWNPEIPFNRKNRLKASERVSKILDDTIPKDVFISLNDILDPGEDIMEEQADRRTHKPILLIFTQGKTPIISQGIKFVTKSSYSHASISFDPELNEVYSYNMRGENFGFIRENLSSFQDNVISVMAFFAPNNIVQTLKNKIKDFQENKTTFDLRIFFNKILHIDHKVSNNEYKQVCSTFVDTVLKSGGINLVGDTEIPDPGQLYNGAKTMPNKIIEVFQDIATKYDGKKVKRKLNLLYDQGTLAINESMLDKIKNYNKYEAPAPSIAYKDGKPLPKTLRKYKNKILPIKLYDQYRNNAFLSEDDLMATVFDPDNLTEITSIPKNKHIYQVAYCNNRYNVILVYEDLDEVEKYLKSKGKTLNDYNLKREGITNISISSKYCYINKEKNENLNGSIFESGIYYDSNNILEEDNNMLFRSFNESTTLPLGVVLRKATKDDADNMFKWQMESIDSNHKNDPKIIKSMKDDVQKSINITKMIMYNDETIGMLTTDILEPGSDYWYIGEIYIVKEYRGKGIGTALLKDEISKHDKLILQVDISNHSAIRLYKSLGFSVREKNDKNKMYVMTLNKKNKKFINETATHSYYRITYNGVGIYEQLKKEMYKINYNSSEWDKFKQSNACNWLPLPPSYCDGYYSYFTKLGYDKFMKNTYPIIIEYLDKNNINIEQCHIDKDSIIYQDKYQIVIDSSNKKPTNESTSILNEACKDIKSAREFVSKVGELAKKYNANYFIVTDGASGIHNNGNPAVRNAREKHIEWERKNNFDPDEDWSKPTNESTSILNEVKKFPVEFDDEGNLINEDVQSLNSSESNDIYHNIDLWESGKSNVIWITGMSGSGKSTIAKEIADEYNAEYVELDNLLRAKIRNSDTIDNGLIDSYIKSVGGLYNVFPYCSNLDKVGWKDIVKEEEKYYKECDRFFDYIIKYANDHKNKKFVIEGVQISDYCIINDKFMQYVKESPIILKMNGPIKTAYRRTKRAIGIGKEKGDNFIAIFKHVATDIHKLMKGKFYIDNYNDLKSIKKYIGESVLNEVKKFPVEFDDEGNLIIYKTRTNSLSYGDEIHDSVQLLESYRNTNNQEGMKYELAKLWFIIDDIEKKMKKRNSSKIDYETLTNNRSTAINVFKTNLEYLMKLDKDFNFAHYYNSTPFSDNGIKVTGSTLKYSLKALRDIIIR